MKQFLVVHVPYVPNFIAGDPAVAEVRAFHSKVYRAMEYANENFKTKCLELVRPGMDSSFRGLTELVESSFGEVNCDVEDSAIIAGLYWDVCHFRMYESLIEKGVREIHLPLDLTDSGSFDKYIEAAKMKYEVIMPGEKIKADGPVVVFYNTWEELVERAELEKVA